MSSAPDLARVAALIGDRARAAMLTHLMSGQTVPATELARVAGVTKQTASTHLARLVSGGLVSVEPSGRNRFFRLAGPDVGELLEDLMGVAQRVGAVRAPSVPGDPALRRARVCYDHLAGELGVFVFASITRQGLLRFLEGKLILTAGGERFFESMGIDLEALHRQRRAFCLACRDWTERRHHLAGALGAAVLEHCIGRGWARRQRGSRALHFSAVGERALRSRFRVPGD
jgi:DNA-binding transcriptional ArsR family regulator